MVKRGPCLRPQASEGEAQHFAGLDISVKETSICIVDETGKIVRKVKVASTPEALLAVLKAPINKTDRNDARGMTIFGTHLLLAHGFSQSSPIPSDLRALTHDTHHDAKGPPLGRGNLSRRPCPARGPARNSATIEAPVAGLPARSASAFRAIFRPSRMRNSRTVGACGTKHELEVKCKIADDVQFRRTIG
jgi:hypothetical protein